MKPYARLENDEDRAALERGDALSIGGTEVMWGAAIGDEFTIRKVGRNQFLILPKGQP